jgi:hypothetical protein
MMITPAHRRPTLMVTRGQLQFVTVASIPAGRPV